mmetsp:Transcript_86090/g.256874  ORF Transcript_86090/g.256874 Transcript_86090/m.256874 type:complete len:361 (-) Transcript_86090:1188-2270(-)
MLKLLVALTVRPAEVSVVRLRLIAQQVVIQDLLLARAQRGHHQQGDQARAVLPLHAAKGQRVVPRLQELAQRGRHGLAAEEEDRLVQDAEVASGGGHFLPRCPAPELRSRAGVTRPLAAVDLKLMDAKSPRRRPRLTEHPDEARLIARPQHRYHPALLALLLGQGGPGLPVKAALQEVAPCERLLPPDLDARELLRQADVNREPLVIQILRSPARLRVAVDGTGCWPLATGGLRRPSQRQVPPRVRGSLLAEDLELQDAEPILGCPCLPEHPHMACGASGRQQRDHPALPALLGRKGHPVCPVRGALEQVLPCTGLLPQDLHARQCAGGTQVHGEPLVVLVVRAPPGLPPPVHRGGRCSL